MTREEIATLLVSFCDSRIEDYLECIQGMPQPSDEQEFIADFIEHLHTSAIGKEQSR